LSLIRVKTILLLSRSGIRFRNCSFWSRYGQLWDFNNRVKR